MKLTMAPAASAQTAAKTQPAAKTVAKPRPMLADIVASIRADARKDSLKYVLRSNTFHDGE
ncbi:hypothetical protein Poly51_10690 [Rubripirellula tenax]|uniref:Uncharacterized protein n=1 Tax=Rubripirellula tenax TaxID=2528015 RepID=A0A5C6FH57_9BACT|nr:hypothetical protein [Rubripirellula tenax]TWU60788.1 hypothetical protein Poly51_10690 [Rubripirellula tenax]